MAYDSNNVFAKILRGELPAHTVYEDSETLAFMDIMPRCEGHTLVIPKAPARNLLDASEAQLAACIRTVQKVGVAVVKAFTADGMTLLQANEGAGGQVVFHLHFHIMPRWDGRPPPTRRRSATRSRPPERYAAAAAVRLEGGRSGG
jgi:histidine triad (HIT) family protein